MSAALDRFVEVLGGGPSGSGVKVHCPVEGHADADPSLFISEKNGKLLVKCFGGCSQEAVIAALKAKELWPAAGAGAGDVSALTLEAYAAAKKLPADFLAGLGLETIYIKKQPCVKIPYYNAAGDEVAVRFRLSLTGDARFRWRAGSRVLPYGLWLLPKFKAPGYVVLVEGESDCQTLWHHRVPAIGVPGAGTWQAGWAEYLEGLEVFVWAEPDQGGQTFVSKVGASRPDCRVITPPPERKDVSACHLAGDDIPALIRQLRDQAKPFVELQEKALSAEAAEAKEAAGELLLAEDLLDRAVRACAILGVVGEEKNLKLLYLALTSRVLERPVNFYVKGSSSGGKSFCVEQVLKLFPASAYYCLTSMSERALAYSEEPLSHRFLVVFEFAGLNNDFATYLLRSLLSEGCIRYETVDKTAEGLKPRLIEREGPTGVILTTTATRVHVENETRAFSVTIDDSAEQTRQVLADLAERRNGRKPGGLDLGPWHALQRWIEIAGAREVAIPFASTLASGANPKALRLRRDFTALLNLIASHAILHQAQRERDATGRIIATVRDYAAVHDLVIDTLNEGVKAAVNPRVRATVNAALEIYARLHGCMTLEGNNLPPPHRYVSVFIIAKELGLEASAAWRRVKMALDGEYLVNDEAKRGRPAKLRPGEPLPAEQSVLPPPDAIEGGEGGILTPPAIAQARNHSEAGVLL